MDGKYLVVRTFWSYQGAQSNSQEAKDSFELAKKRAYTILGSDIASETIAKEIVTILNPNGLQVFLEVIDNRTPEPEAEE